MTFLAESNERLRHEVATLRIQLSDFQITIAAQAEVIKAQRANLDAARKLIDDIEKHAIYWNGISALDDDMTNAERWSETAKRCRAALEGIEPD